MGSCNAWLEWLERRNSIYVYDFVLLMKSRCFPWISPAVLLKFRYHSRESIPKASFFLSRSPMLATESDKSPVKESPAEPKRTWQTSDSLQFGNLSSVTLISESRNIYTWFQCFFSVTSIVWVNERRLKEIIILMMMRNYSQDGYKNIAAITQGVLTSDKLNFILEKHNSNIWRWLKSNSYIEVMMPGRESCLNREAWDKDKN
jgi:hypothetical protein